MKELKKEKQRDVEDLKHEVEARDTVIRKLKTEMNDLKSRHQGKK